MENNVAKNPEDNKETSTNQYGALKKKSYHESKCFHW